MHEAKMNQKYNSSLLITGLEWSLADPDQSQILLALELGLGFWSGLQ